MQKHAITAVLILAISFAGAAHGQTGKVAVYGPNPHYLAVGGEPVFLIGATHQFGWMAISKPDHDFMADLERLGARVAEVGSPHVRGLARIIPYFPAMDGIQPWKQLPNNQYDLNAFNPAWEHRLRAYLQAALQRDVIVSLEIWDDWSITRGEGGQYNPGPQIGWFVWNGPWHAWNDHPFNGANNVNYGTDVMPAVTSVANAPFYRSILPQHPESEALQYQTRYVDHLLSIARDYPNVIYNLSNESRAPLSWSRYWAKYLRDRLGGDAIIGDMPSTNREDGRGEIDPEMDPLTLIGDDSYSYVDVSQAVSSHSFGKEGPAKQAYLAGRRLGSYYAAMKKQGVAKPLVVSKDYTNTPKGGISVLWAKFLGGAASARFHRPMIHNAKMPPVEEITDFQFESIINLGLFVKQVAFWNYLPDTETVIKTPEGVYALAMANDGEGYVIQVIGAGRGELNVRLAPGAYQLRWFDPYAGRYIEEADPPSLLESDHLRETLSLSLPERDGDVIAHITRKN